MQPTHKDGTTHIQRLDPGKIDVVLGASARKARAAPKPSVGWGSWGLILALGLGGVAYWHSSRPGKPPALATLPAPALAAEPDLQTPSDAPGHAHTFAPISTAPAEYTPPVAPSTPAPRTGLVSQAYLEQLHNRPQAQANRRAYERMTATIPGVKGNRYQATWRIYAGDIDSGSVCENFAQGSGERMDCRAAAQAFFQEQCKSWARRAEASRDDVVRASKAQYCSASEQFRP